MVDKGTSGYSSLQPLMIMINSTASSQAGAAHDGGQLGILYEQTDELEPVMNPDRFVYVYALSYV